MLKKWIKKDKMKEWGILKRKEKKGGERMGRRRRRKNSKKIGLKKITKIPKLIKSPPLLLFQNLRIDPQTLLEWVCQLRLFVILIRSLLYWESDRNGFIENDDVVDDVVDGGGGGGDRSGGGGCELRITAGGDHECWDWKYCGCCCGGGGGGHKNWDWNCDCWNPWNPWNLG